MAAKFYIPSKSFLYGEYAVLAGGPSAVLATSPFFSFTVSPQGEGRCEGVHPLSPAGKLLRENNQLFKDMNCHFFDPHFEAGGFGASVAQFLGVLAWVRLSENAPEMLRSGFSLEEVWKEYRQWAFQGEGTPPSGADLLAQIQGQLSRFQMTPFRASNSSWPFAEGDFLIVRTGHKIATHKHLAEVKTEALKPLCDGAAVAEEALLSADWSAFVEAIKNYRELLKGSQLEAEATTLKLSALAEYDAISAAKGCGAMGADTLILLFNAENKSEVLSICENLKLPVVASRMELASGLRSEWDWQSNVSTQEVSE